MSADLHNATEQRAPVAARSFPCVRCGAALAPAPGAIVCEHCHLRQPAPAEWVAELQSYEAAVVRTEAATEHHQAAVAEARGAFGMSSSDSGSLLSRNIPLVLGIPIGLVLLGVIVLLALTLTTEVGLWVVRGAVLAVVALLFWWSRRRQLRVNYPTRVLACSRCGAPNEVEVGPGGGSCKHCRAPISPPPTVMAEALLSAQFARQNAAIAHARVARRAAAKAYEVERSRMPLVASVVGVITVGSLLLAQWYLVAGATALAAGAAVIAIRRFDGDKRARLVEAMATLGAELGARPIRWLWDQVAWLNAFWFAEYASINFDQSRVYAGLWLEQDGYPILIEVDLKRFRRSPFTTDFGQRIEIFVAAEVPQQGPASAEVVTRLDRMRAEGFSLEWTAWGLRAYAELHVIDRCRAAPESIRVVGSVLRDLVAVAVVSGCRPGVATP